MSKAMLDQIRTYYRKGIYKKSQIDAMLAAKKITAEEYAYIVGDGV